MAGETKAKDIKLSEVLVALPLMHLFMASLFLYGYCAGFGANLGRFSSPPDLFAISISEIAWIYVASILFLGITWVQAFVGDITLAAAKPKSRRARLIDSAVMAALVLGVALLMIMVPAGIIVEKAQRGHYAFLAALFIVCSQAGPLVGMLLRRAGRPRWSRVAAASVTTLAGMSLFFGVMTGELHRVRPIAELKRYPACAGQPVLRQLGGRFLVVLPDGRRALATFECKPVIIFPMAEREIWPEWWPQGLRFEVSVTQSVR